VVFVSHMLILYPTLRANSQWLGPVVTRFRTQAREVWLTIDDGPDEDTLAILDVLARYDARATFFVKGTKAERRPDLLQQITAAGSSVANHSHTHPSATFWCLGSGRIAAEIDSCGNAIASALAARPRLFRAPVGMKNPFVHPLLAKRQLRLIGWSARGFDGVLLDPQTVAERVLEGVTPGAILLMHQGRIVDRTPVSVLAIERVVREATTSGYRFVIPGEERLM
jgi:peptidoglycan-N-acetylglucosamine deacetylase